MRASRFLCTAIAAGVALGVSGCLPSPPSASPGAGDSCGDGLATAYIDATGGVAPDPSVVGAPAAGFEPAAALTGLDVECSVTFTAPGNGLAGTRRVSFAVVEDDPVGSVTAALTAFIAAGGYVSDEDHPDGGDGFVEWQLLEEGSDSLYAAEWLHFDEIDPAATASGYEAMALAHTDASPGDWVVVNINERR